jgi:hypothetical protein
MTDTDKRSVATDALATLGTVIGENEKRDAIHLAVLPTVAGQYLRPGDHVGLREDGSAVAGGQKFIGIVDPFLTKSLQPGERFWLVIYPRQITSLRHVWEHPDVPDAAAVPAADPKAVSEAWIRDFGDRIDQGSRSLMEAATLWVEQEDYTFSGENEGYKDASDEDWRTFWGHYEVLTGKRPKPGKEEWGFFSCSC